MLMFKKQTYKLILQTGDPSSFEVRQEAGPQIWEDDLGCPTQEPAESIQINQGWNSYDAHSSCPLHVSFSVRDVILAVESHEGTTGKICGIGIGNG